MADTARPVRAITDPTLLPSIVPRIQAIGRLLEQIRDTPLPPSDEARSTEQPMELTSTAADTSLPNLALGTINDEEDWDPWSQTDTTSTSERHIPTELLQALAREATALQSTLTDARRAVDAAPGSDMSVDEQVSVIATSEAYQQKQAYVYNYVLPLATFMPSGQSCCRH